MARGFGGVRRVFRLGAPCGVGVFLLLECHLEAHARGKACKTCALRLGTRAAAADRSAAVRRATVAAFLTRALDWASALMDASLALLFNCEFRPYTRSLNPAVTQNVYRTTAARDSLRLNSRKP